MFVFLSLSKGLFIVLYLIGMMAESKSPFLEFICRPDEPTSPWSVFTYKYEFILLA